MVVKLERLACLCSLGKMDAAAAVLVNGLQTAECWIVVLLYFSGQPATTDYGMSVTLPCGLCVLGLAGVRFY